MDNMHGSKSLFSPNEEQKEINWSSEEWYEIIKSVDTERTRCEGKHGEKTE